MSDEPKPVQMTQQQVIQKTILEGIVGLLPSITNIYKDLKKTMDPRDALTLTTTIVVSVLGNGAPE